VGWLEAARIEHRVSATLLKSLPVAGVTGSSPVPPIPKTRCAKLAGLSDPDRAPGRGRGTKLESDPTDLYGRMNSRSRR
ncbi:MAG TPA: hypothetical protein VEY87_12295, partial [Gaiellaceae bacterium]|nr:hypothetical protein [Gaiellaceae bacterium]